MTSQSKEEERSGIAEERPGADAPRLGAESGQAVVEVHARNRRKGSHSVSPLEGHWQKGGNGRAELGFSRSNWSTLGPGKYRIQPAV